MRLRNKVVIITGGGSGIGRAAAILFAKEGAKVTVADVEEKNGLDVVGSIKKNGGKAVFVRTDVSKAADTRKMVKTTIQKFGKLDILINNAGVRGAKGGVTKASEEDWDRVMGINVKGIFLGSKYAIPAMLKNGGGVIINTASASGLKASPLCPAYCASKGAVINLTKSIALDYGDKNIRCNCVCPGVIDTGFYDSYGDRDKIVKMALKGNLVGRAGKPDDVAYAMLYLATDESAFAQGSALLLDGGMMAFTRT
jgi:NAD(P)-dependent dehydrogenase (short-subunit alcohol dehydrogenase family)